MRDRVGCNKLDPELLICISNNIGRIGKHNEIDESWRQGLDRKGIGFNFDRHLVEDIDCDDAENLCETGAYICDDIADYCDYGPDDGQDLPDEFDWDE